MFGFLKKIINNLLLIFIFLIFAYQFQGEISSVFSQVKKKYLPCATPVYYTLGAFDDRFGMSKEEFLAYLAESERVWEEPLGKNLFEYKDNALLKINLVYDTRQHTTNLLQDVNADIEGGKAKYESEKAKFDTMKAEYEKARNTFDVRISVFEARQGEYNAEVARWNNRGGAPDNVYSSLEAERIALQKEASALNTAQYALNQKVLELNSFSRYLNDFAGKLNLAVAEYNEIGKTHVEEFEEGVYHIGPDGEWIDIYQFENETKLKRVLAHELGHALGLDHVEDQSAIMYRLNESENTLPTKEDLEAVRTLCKI